MRTLVVAAHPDDEILGAGGTVIALAGHGHEVFLAVLGEGVTSRFSQRDDETAARVRDLHEQCRQVSRSVGAVEVTLHDLPDNQFDTLPLLKVVKIVEDLIERIRPQRVLTHHGGDLNVDHAITHRAVLTATRPVKGHPVREVWTFEVPSATDWAFQQLQPTFRPNTFFDISGTLERKLRALEQYEAEMRPFPHPRSVAAVESQARRWGAVVGVEAAEAFELVRSIRTGGAP
jgi:LmbE family N-acetylglucosaminyl deacetylase